MKNDNKPTPAAPAVHRYVAIPQGRFKLKMPKDAEILDVTIGSKGLNLYALTDPTKAAPADIGFRYFFAVPTGTPIPFGWECNFVKLISIGGPALHLFAVPAHIAKKIGFKTFSMGKAATD